MAGSSCQGIAPTVQLGNSWAGNDGNWSTFAVAVGTPPQNFSVLPALTSGETWVPVPMGCQTSNVQACASSRGVGTTNGSASPGFNTDKSTTWDLIGLYALKYERNLFGWGNNGLYGQDTIDLGQSAVGEFKIRNQTVAGIATPDFWLGMLGLGVSPSQFDSHNGYYSALLPSMKSARLTPSLSLGYSAGASYRNAAGSLVFGGYDRALFTPDPISYQISSTDDTALGVRLQGVIVTNSLSGTFSLPVAAGGVTLALDSSTAQLWLPKAWCDSFADAFSLVYDNATDLYLFNTTTYNQTANANVELTFTLSSDDGKTTNIVFPFSAFDLEVGSPAYPDARKYFPIRQAANESQYVLGRAFMQEAYIAVDWERGNLTIGQNSHADQRSVTSICPPPAPARSSGLSPGAIAGIVIGVVAGFALLMAGLWFACATRRRKAGVAAASESVSELEGAEKSKAELMSTSLFEMHEPEQQLMSSPIYELPTQVHELVGSPTHAELPNNELRRDEK